MSMQYCTFCDQWIDTDYNAEHFPHNDETEGDFSGATEYSAWEGR